MIALNDAIADGRDVSWIWDVDFEPLLDGLDRLVATGSRAAELALRFAYGGLARDRIEVVPSLEAALDRGLELTPAGGELDRAPHLHRDARAAPDRRRRAATSRTTGSAPHEDPRRPSLSGLPEHLRRPRQHRGARRARARRAATSSTCRRSGSATRCRPARSTSSTSAAARTASRRSSRAISRRRRRRSARPSRPARRSSPSAAATSCSGASTATSRASSCPGSGCCRCTRSPGERRMIGDVLLDCAWAGETLAGFENHAGRTILDDGRRAARPRRLAASGTTARRGDEGCRWNRVYGTYLHGPLLPRNPWFADRLLADALAHAGGADGARAARRRARDGGARGLGRARPSARRQVLSW